MKETSDVPISIARSLHQYNSIMDHRIPIQHKARVDGAGHENRKQMPVIILFLKESPINAMIQRPPRQDQRPLRTRDLLAIIKIDVSNTILRDDFDRHLRNHGQSLLGMSPLDG